MPNSSSVTVAISDAVGTITLDAPKRRNALGPEMLADLGDAFRTLAADRAVRAVVVTGAGEHFSAGGDISVFDRGVAAGRDYVYDAIGVFRQIEHLRKPVIAAVRGYALGGGFELAMSCDLVVASDSAQFGLPEISVGAVPAFALIRLGELIGRARAKQVAWLGKRLSAAQAYELGLAAEVVADGELDRAAHQMAASFTQLPRVATEVVKAALNREIADRSLFESTTAAAMMWGTEGIAEGRRAFYAKRAPQFPDE
ncbi:Enoyl-CoA hydratase/isomerase [Mycolicibacterium rhodesiae JS60]|nr:Enoyl-CoA hydratase/isomerase [Mycolicibacterium rhodesiae JS60]